MKLCEQVVGRCRREVLVRHRDHVAFPELADPAHCGSDHLRADRGALQARLQRIGQHRFGRDRIRVVQRMRVALSEHAKRAGRRVDGLAEH
jgi:hypothetical protein